MVKKVKKIGLALGGGAARGWSHIGVIRVLEKAGIPIDYIAGTSIGSLIGGVYASGKMDALEDLALKLDVKKVMGYLDMAYSKNGLLDGKKVKTLLSGHFTKKRIEDVRIPFIAVATDIETGKEIQFKSGNLVEAIRASISIPGIFTPVKKGKMYLVDGGLVNPVPVNVVRQMGADIVIAVRKLPEEL
jgi:NTE family protein